MKFKLLEYTLFLSPSLFNGIAYGIDFHTIRGAPEALMTLNRKEMKNDSNTNSCIGRRMSSLTDKRLTGNTTKRVSFLNDKGGWKKIWGGMRTSELDFQHYKNKLQTVSGLNSDEVTLVSCFSVDDVVPTMVDWQGQWMPQDTSSNIVKIPSTTTNVNTFLAYTDFGDHCRMVLFQIARDPDTDTCSYQQLAAKYKAGTCDENVVYCTFLEGECQNLVGDNTNGYGIETLTYEFPTSRTNNRAPICTVAKEDVKKDPCLSSLVDLFIPHNCNEGSPCDVGFCVGGTCTDGQLGTECNGPGDCASGFCVNNKCAKNDGADGAECKGADDCESGFCVDGTCADGQVDSECVNNDDCLSENCEVDSKKCQPHIATNLGSDEVDLGSSYDCTSVDDVVPTMVDWQGQWMPQDTSSNIVKIPSTTTNVNTFLAYTDFGDHCRMVLFQIARDPDTDTCSYQQLAAKYKAGTCDENVVYCTFLEGECQNLVGDNTNGYGIETLTYEFPTSRTNNRAPICTVAEDYDYDRSENDCLSSLADQVLVPYACNGKADCDVGFCVGGTCTDGQLGTECNGPGDCASGFCVNNKCAKNDGADGAECTDNDDCINKFCVNNKCAENGGTTGDDCNDNDDCLSKLCGLGYQCAECSVDTHCHAEGSIDSICINTAVYGVCTDKENGSKCIDDAHCLSGLCGAEAQCRACKSRSECHNLGYCVDGVCTDGEIGSTCNSGKDCVLGFCVHDKCAVNNGVVGAECKDNDDCLSSKCGEDDTCAPHSIAGLNLLEMPLIDTDCTSVDDIIPTAVDWQGKAMLGSEGTDTIVKITPTLSNINRFLAYTYTGGHCKMVLFQIERDTATNVCSYKPLAGKYGPKNQDCSVDDKGPYCTFLKGTCTELVGDNSDGYGIEALDYEYKTTNEPQTDTCEDTFTADTTDFLCTDRGNGDVCIADSDCDSGLCGAYDGLCKGSDGSQCAQSTDCKSYLCGAEGQCKTCSSGSECEVSGLGYCVDGVCTDDPCENITCGENETCNPSTGKCSCNDGYQLDPYGNCAKVDEGDPVCADDNSFTFERVLKDGTTKITRCSWFTLNPKQNSIDRRRFKFCYDNKPACDKPSEIGSKCKHACGFCDEIIVSPCPAFASKCTDDPDFKFPMKRDPNEKRGCSWITWNDEKVDRRRSNYCSKKYILRKCPIACNRKLCV